MTKKWLREHMHESIPDTIRKLNAKRVGHYRYYGIYGNWISLEKFYWDIKSMELHPLAYPKIYVKSAYQVKFLLKSPIP